MWRNMTFVLVVILLVLATTSCTILALHDKNGAAIVIGFCLGFLVVAGLYALDDEGKKCSKR